MMIFFLLGDGLVHLNMRVSLGRFGLCLNNPQYHRIHHSVEPQHRDKNFCKMFPLFDVIFGTAWKPGKDEFPKTGLTPRETATGFLDGIIWPVRHRLPVQRMNRLLLQTGENTARLIPRI
jgi:sterol desaturase/sphingolipid hydroxylase (fatty acid hydroxylase superfamily)